MSNTRNNNLDHNRTARKQYARACTAAYEAIVRRSLDGRMTRVQRNRCRNRAGAFALAPAATDMSIRRLATCVDAYTSHPVGSATLDPVIGKDCDTVAEGAFDGVVPPSREPLTRIELAVQPAGFAAVGRNPDIGDDVAKRSTCIRNLDDGVGM